MSNVIVSGSRLPVRPSASEGPIAILTSRPAARLLVNGHDAATSTPTTRVDGDRDFTAMPIPLISPPPPTGTTMTSSPGRSSSSSSAIVPAPAMTSGWEYGEMNKPSPRAACAFACRSASS